MSVSRLRRVERWLDWRIFRPGHGMMVGWQQVTFLFLVTTSTLSAWLRLRWKMRSEARFLSSAGNTQRKQGEKGRNSIERFVIVQESDS